MTRWRYVPQQEGTRHEVSRAAEPASHGSNAGRAHSKHSSDTMHKFWMLNTGASMTCSEQAERVSASRQDIGRKRSDGSAHQWRNALRRNMAVNCSLTRLNISWMAVVLPRKVALILSPFGGMSQICSSTRPRIKAYAAVHDRRCEP